MLRHLRFALSGYVAVVTMIAMPIQAVLANEPPWPVSFKATQEKAKAQNKYIVAAFVGSDWCPYCKALRENIFDKPAFTASVREQFVLVEIDFPHEKKQIDAIKEQNHNLQQKYGVYTYPTVLLLKPDGAMMAHAGYGGGNDPKKYVSHLIDLAKTYESALALRQQLPLAKGIERAKLLDQLIEHYEKLDNEIGALPGRRKEIVSLDADNAVGLRHKYEFRTMLDDARRALQNGHPVVAEAAADKALALTGITPVQMQNALIVKSNCCVALKKYQASIDCLHKALDSAGGKGRNADELKSLLERSEKLLKAEKKD